MTQGHHERQMKHSFAVWEVTRLNGPARLNGAITDAVRHNQELLLKLPPNPQKLNAVSVECGLSALVKKKKS